MMDEGKRFSLVKPTIDTPFHIDFLWWQQHDNNWKVYLQSCLCIDHQKIFADLDQACCIDYIDPDTAEVISVDGLQHILITHCARQPGFIIENSALIESVFRILLANGNTPLTPKEISLRINRPADIILRTLTGPRIYRGIRPFSN